MRDRNVNKRIDGLTIAGMFDLFWFSESDRDTLNDNNKEMHVKNILAQDWSLVAAKKIFMGHFISLIY